MDIMKNADETAGHASTTTRHGNSILAHLGRTLATGGTVLVRCSVCTRGMGQWVTPRKQSDRYSTCTECLAEVGA